MPEPVVPVLWARPPSRGRGQARTVVGRTYLLAGAPVTVVTGWGPGGGPANVRVRFPDGSTTVRPFRGLRRP